jgi:hypothetical protein
MFMYVVSGEVRQKKIQGPESPQIAVRSAAPVPSSRVSQQLDRNDIHHTPAATVQPLSLSTQHPRTRRDTYSK